ncbi:MAG TPA: hypothetical protein VGW14_08905 [Thermoleophilaceae bacterium]|nr:hypothetical protein [Thermoleophilaceae bacterium]
MELDSEIDRLYGVPLDEFVRNRDELAKRLRREGEREDAERVKKLRKPSAGAWALNQAVRRRRKETDALLAAGERLREAHESLLSGGDPAQLREAMQEERGLASTLADCAEAIASETGKSGPALRERVRSTLHAATVDDEAREELATGRFVREREAVGLGTFGAGPAPAGAPPKGRRAKAGRGRGSTKEGRSATRTKEPPAAEREKAAERERRERLAEAERSVEEAREGLGEAEVAHSEAASVLQAAREAVGEAEDAEREARAVARERRRALGKLERELERLRGKRR